MKRVSAAGMTMENHGSQKRWFLPLAGQSRRCCLSRSKASAKEARRSLFHE